MSESTDASTPPELEPIWRRVHSAWKHGDYINFVAANRDAERLEGEARAEYVRRVAALGGTCC